MAKCNTINAPNKCTYTIYSFLLQYPPNPQFSIILKDIFSQVYQLNYFVLNCTQGYLVTTWVNQIWKSVFQIPTILFCIEDARNYKHRRLDILLARNNNLTENHGWFHYLPNVRVAHNLQKVRHEKCPHLLRVLGVYWMRKLQELVCFHAYLQIACTSQFIKENSQKYKGNFDFFVFHFFG